MERSAFSSHVLGSLTRIRKKEDPMNTRLLRVGEAAEVLNVSRWTIYRWIEEGRLEATKIGKGSLRVFEKSVQRLVETNRKDQFSLVVH